MTKEQRNYNVVMDTYRALYRASTPSADFDKLVEEAELDEDGRKVIPFENYIVEPSKMDEIIMEQAKKGKLTKHETELLKTQVYLGCSPSFPSREEKENDKQI